MLLYSDYYRRRLDAQATRIMELDKYKPKINYITGKKRKYEEAMGYPIDCDNIIQEAETKVNEESS
jgi:hypothetical protein